AKLKVDPAVTDEAVENVALARNTVLTFPALIEQVNRQLRRPLEQKPPNYKGAADTISTFVESFDAQVGQIIANFRATKGGDKLPADVRQYIADSLPRYEALKKLTGAVVEQTKNLGELKLDTLRQSLSQRNSILVLGENDIKVIGEEKVWQDDVDRPAMMRAGDVKLKSKFAGEQQVTSAILSLSQKTKPVVVFVRPGGPAMTSPGIPGFQRGGPFAAVAERLRDYNFDVVEKDLSGQSAMQPPMQGMPPEPEATDEQLKTGVWVVLNYPTQQNPMMGFSPPSPVGPKLAEHLKQGGSALVLNAPRADALEEALKDWGVSLQSGKLVVHESAAGDGPRSRDLVEEAKKVPYIFVLQEYGQHPLAKALASLDGVIVPLMPVQTRDAAGVKTTPLLPIPTTPKSWGESDTEDVFAGNKPTFDEKADTAAPVFGGAAAEKADGTGGRLVVLGSLEFATNQLVILPDEELLRRGVLVARFPGNAELVQNSVFWLARQEPMIAISPAAMEVSRIGPMSDATLRAWRVGLLLIALPGAVLAAGVMTYFARRD
ncbi:MAG TPA: hypothetical protein VK324_00780, partial [Tepidisphaeraceae bacterium]|nr:hypothetical protein [Tepidisphaeraceae bacterium]